MVVILFSSEAQADATWHSSAYQHPTKYPHDGRLIGETTVHGCSL